MKHTAYTKNDVLALRLCSLLFLANIIWFLRCFTWAVIYWLRTNSVDQIIYLTPWLLILLVSAINIMETHNAKIKAGKGLVNSDDLWHNDHV